MVFLSQDAAAGGAASGRSSSSVVAAEGQRAARLARRAVTPRHASAALARAAAAACPAGLRRAQGAAASDPDAFERKLYVIRRVVEKAVLAEHAGSISSTCRACSSRTLVYTGMLMPTQIAAFFPDLTDPSSSSAMCARALALQHQHLRRLGSRAPVPLPRAQRRDQHDAGNQNWMRAREGTLRSALFGDDLQKLFPIMREGGSDSRAFDNVLEFLVLHRPRAARSDPDDDPGGVGEPGRHGSRAARLLRVPLVPDGAVGRPRVDRVHRRPQDRRGARPQRPAPLALHGHEGRLRGDGVRGRRARHRPRERAAARSACSRAASSSSTSSRAASSRTRRSSGRYVGASTRTASGSSSTACCSTICRAPQSCPSAMHEIRSCASGSSRCSATRREDLRLLLAPMAAEGKWPIGSMGDDAALACLSRSPAACSTTTSSSSSRRSRTRRWTRSTSAR